MFNIKRKDLDYEKCMKFFLEDGEEQQMDPNVQQPMEQQQDPNVGMTPDQVYQQALAEMDKKIEETGRKRFQKYKKRRRCLLFLFIIQVYDFYAQRFLQLRSERIL